MPESNDQLPSLEDLLVSHYRAAMRVRRMISTVGYQPLPTLAFGRHRTAVQRNPTATSARFRASQFRNLETSQLQVVAAFYVPQPDRGGRIELKFIFESEKIQRSFEGHASTFSLAFS